MQPPFTVQRLDHIVLRVKDLAASVVFYDKVLGCQVVKTRPDLGLIHLRCGTSMIDLISIDGPLGSTGGPPAGAEARNVDHVCLRVDTFDEGAIIAHLAQHGLAPLGPASDNFGAEGDGLSLYLQDIDGNTIELKGAARP